MSLRVRCCAFRISDPLRSGEVPSIPRGLAFSWKGVEGWLVGWGRRIRMEETYTMRGERERRGCGWSRLRVRIMDKEVDGGFPMWVNIWACLLKTGSLC